MRIPDQRRSRHAGFSIVEALVALVVLSIGMLGIAALYVESLRAGRSAIYRTQAVNLASDMADRIRANRNARESYDIQAGDAPPGLQRCAPPDNAVCSPQQLADDDVTRWLTAITEQLPAGPGGQATGTVTVTTPAAAPQTRQYSIEVSWFEPGEGNQAMTYMLNMQI